MSAVGLYRGLPARVRWHVGLRAWTCPMEAVADRLPREGRLLDVGCGHGLFSNLAALSNPALSVLGVDPSEEKIHWASASASGRDNPRFLRGSVEDLPEDGFDVVAVLDVLYLVQRERWPAFLGACRDRLRSGGLLLLKEVDLTPRWKFYRCMLQETMSVRLLGITLGRAFAFAGRDEMRAALEEAGFRDLRCQDLGRGYLTPHLLYEAARG